MGLGKFILVCAGIGAVIGVIGAIGGGIKSCVYNAAHGDIDFYYDYESKPQDGSFDGHVSEFIEWESTDVKAYWENQATHYLIGYYDKDFKDKYFDSDRTNLIKIKKDGTTAFYAKRGIKNIWFTLDSNGGYFDYSPLDKYVGTYYQEIPTEMLNLPTCSKEGLFFDGYYLADDFSSSSYPVTNNLGEYDPAYRMINTENYPSNLTTSVDNMTNKIILKAKYVPIPPKEMTISVNGSNYKFKSGDTITFDEIGGIPYQEDKCFESYYSDSSFIKKFDLPYEVTDDSPDKIDLFPKYSNATNDWLKYSIGPSVDEYVVSYAQGTFAQEEFLVIPDYHNGKKITQLGSIKGDLIRKVLVPHEINTIKPGCFEGDSRLVSFDLASTKVDTIYSNTFKGCSVLSEINIPSRIVSIDESAFEDCRNLKSVTMPFHFDSELSPTVFKGCTALEEFINVNPDAQLNRKFKYETLLNGALCLKTLDSKTKQNNLKIYKFPAGSTMKTFKAEDSNIIGVYDYAFESCKNLSTLNIKAPLTSFSESALIGCTNLKIFALTNVASTLTLAKNTFNDTINLQSIVISPSGTGIIKLPENALDTLTTNFSIILKRDNLSAYTSDKGWGKYVDHFVCYDNIVDNFVFAYSEESDDQCYVVTYTGNESSLVMSATYDGKALMGVYDYAFYNNDDLSSVDFGKYTSYFGACSFKDCDSLTKVTLRSEFVATCDSTTFDYKNIRFYVPGSLVGSYLSAWQSYFPVDSPASQHIYSI